MPTLKQLTCHIEHSNSKVPLSEYGTSYADGVVWTFVAVPSTLSPSSAVPIPAPFAIRLQSNGYIAPGLAMFVFIDGVYQCNRNRDDLVWGEHGRNGNASDWRKGNGKGKEGVMAVDFRVRQKEERREDGAWVGRPWRFEEFQVVNSIPDMSENESKALFAKLGQIEVIVLRCMPGPGQASGASGGTTTPDSAMAEGFEGLSNDEWNFASSMAGHVGSRCDGDNGETYYGAYPYQQYYHPYANGPYPNRNWEQPHWKQYGAAHNQPWDNGQGHAYPAAPPPPPPPPPPSAPAPYPPFYYVPGYDYAAYMPPYNGVSPPGHPAFVPPQQRPTCTKCGRQKPSKEKSDDNKESHGKRCKKCGQDESPAKSSGRYFYSHPAPQYVNGRWFHCPAAPIPGPNQPTERTGQTGTAPYTSHQGANGHSIVFNVNGQPYQGHGHYPHPADDQGPYVIANGQRVYSDCDHCRHSFNGKNTGSKDKKNGKEKKTSNKKKKKKDEVDANNPWGQQDDDDGGSSKSDSGKSDSQKSNKSQESKKSKASDEKKEEGWGAGGGDDNNQPQGGVTWDSSDAFASGNQNNQNGQGQQSGGDPFMSGNKRQNSPQPANNDGPNQQQGQQNASQGPTWQHQGQQGPPLPVRGQNGPSYAHRAPANGVSSFVFPGHQEPVTDEPPLYTVPASLAKHHSLTHQVQLGNSSSYSHKIRAPQYLDTLEEPYARFVFQYRRKDIIEKMFRVAVDRDVDLERKIIESLPRDQLIEQLLRAQGLQGNGPPLQQPMSRNGQAQRWDRNAVNNQNNNLRNTIPPAATWPPPPPLSPPQNYNVGSNRAFFGHQSQSPVNHSQPNAADLSARLENLKSHDNNRGQDPRPQTSHAAGDPHMSTNGHGTGGPSNGGDRGDPHSKSPASSSQPWVVSGSGTNENGQGAWGGGQPEATTDTVW